MRIKYIETVLSECDRFQLEEHVLNLLIIIIIFHSICCYGNANLLYERQCVNAHVVMQSGTRFEFWSINYFDCCFHYDKEK